MHKFIPTLILTAISTAVIITIHLKSEHTSLESAGLQSPLVEKVPSAPPFVECNVDHFPCDKSSIFPDPEAPEIAWDHKYSKDMVIPRGLGYYHIKPLKANRKDTRIWGKLGPSKGTIESFQEGNSIPQGVGYYPGETEEMKNSGHNGGFVAAEEHSEDNFIPRGLGFFTSEVPYRIEDTDGFDETQSYMRDPTFYHDAYRSAYPFDGENKPHFYEAAS
jgi:hypothetical protein